MQYKLASNYGGGQGEKERAGRVCDVLCASAS
jgi:hypothetical protein